MGSQLFCLKWNNHQANMLSVFDQLLKNEAFVDVTIACDGMRIKAHKMVLSACSPYFQDLFLENPCKHPIVILKDIKCAELQAVIDFMYKGEINVSHDELSGLLKTAESLKIKGLAEVNYPQKHSLLESNTRHENASEDFARSHKKRRKKELQSDKCNVLDQTASNAPLCSPHLAHSADDANDAESVEELSTPYETSDVTPVPPSSGHIVHVKNEIIQEIVPESPKDCSEDLSNPSANSNEDVNPVTDDSEDCSDNNIAYLTSEKCFQKHKDISTSFDGSLASTSKENTLGLYRKSKKSTWTVPDLMKAINAVRSGQMNVLKAAITFGIPKSSLYDYISGRTGVRLRVAKKMKPYYPILTITGHHESGQKQVPNTAQDAYNTSKTETPNIV